MPHTRIPVTVLGGFLGAGKTTLLNRLLADEALGRCAVLVNDFGALNIDVDLVRARDAQRIELSNGCVCCQIGGDLSSSLAQVLQRAELPQSILIEASGVADPWPVAQVALADPLLSLEGVIVIINQAAFAEDFSDPLLADTLLRQLHSADLLVLNQTDRATATQQAAAAALLDRHVPRTPRYVGQQGELPAPWREALCRLDDERLPHTLLGQARASLRTADGQAQLSHGEVFESWAWLGAKPLRTEALHALMQAMPEGVMRLKGLVQTDRHWRAVLHYAGRHGSLRAAETHALGPQFDEAASVPDRLSVSRIVAIGPKGRLPTAALAHALQQATVA